MKRILSLALLLTLSGACGTVDLRPENARSAPTDAQVQEARALLKKMADAHGTQALFERSGPLRFTFSDDWSMAGFPLAIAAPWPEKTQRAIMTQMPMRMDSSLRLLNGDDANVRFLIDDARGNFRISKEGKEIATDDSLVFISKAIAFFIQAPFHLAQADIAFVLDPVTVGKKTYPRVFVSWNSAEPQEDTDQYVVWLDPESGRLAFIDYTVRDAGAAIKGTMQYEDDREVGGLWFARTLRVVGKMNGKTNLHEVKLLDIETNLDVTTLEYAVPGLNKDKKQEDESAPPSSQPAPPSSAPASASQPAPETDVD